MPVAIERRSAFTWIRALPHLLPAAPLADAAIKPTVDRAAAAGLAELQRARRACGGEWACYRPVSAPVESDALARCAGETRWMEAAVVDLSRGAEDASRRMDRKTRQDVARTRAHGVTYEERADALEEAYALHVRQARAWSAHRPLPLELSRRLLDQGVAQLLIARDAGGLLCATLALDSPRETFLWWSGAHPGARAAEAYPGLMWWAAERAAGRGRARLNLGASRGIEPLERFKRSLGATAIRYPVRWLDASAAPPLGRLLAAAQRWRRRGRARGSAA